MLFGNRHRKLSALFDALRPALHDRLLLGVEAHAFSAVSMHVAEQALFPTSLDNGMPMLDVDSYWQMIVKGSIWVWVDVSTRAGRR